MTRKIAVYALLIAGSIGACAQERNLEYYVQQSIKNSPLLRDFENQIFALQLDSLIFQKSLLPQVNANSNLYYAPLIKGYGYDEALTNIHTLDALISVTQQLYSGSFVNNQYRSFQLSKDSLRIAGKVSELDLRKTITAQYITAYGDLEQLKANREILDILYDGQTLLKKLTEHGVYKETEYVTYIVTVKQQELQTQQSLIQYQSDLGVLNYLSGVYDTSYTELAEPALAPSPKAEPRNNWLFRQFEIDSLKLKISEEQIDFNYKPKISWTFDAGFNSSLTPEWYKNFGLSAGLSFSLPLFDWGQRDLQRQKLIISDRTRRYYRDKFLIQFNQQTSMLLQQLQTTEQLIQITREQAKYSEALIAANKRLLAAGDVRVIDFITSINDYLTIRKLIRQNIVSKYLIINQINYWNGY